MTEVLLPTWIVPEVETQEWLDEGSVVFPSAFAPGLTQRQSYGGLRLKLSRRHTVRGEEKAQLMAVLNQTRGRYNVLRTKVHFALRGAISASEIQSNPTFADGTTSWSSNDTGDTTISVSDRILRMLRVGNDGSAVVILGPTSTAVLYAPYAVRTYLRVGRGPTTWSLRIRDASDSSTNYANSGTLTDDGYKVASGVPYDTDVRFAVADNTSGKLAGDYMEVNWTSLARCMLVDAGLNSLLQSDEFDTTWAVTRSSIDDQTAGTTAPDGTITADALHEDSTAASTHYVEQTGIVVSSSAEDYSFACALKAANRSWGSISILEGTGSTELGADFDLANGVVGTTRAGANWTNVRSFIQSLGEGWYYCCVVGRKTNSATSLTARIWVGEADNDRTFTGLNQDSIYLWRGTLAQSSVPTRLISTTTTASTGTSPTGNAMHVRGLQASTNGLLLPGDYFEINGELKQVTAPLNSDAAGLGYLQFEPALVRSPANDDPVIVVDPMGKFLVSNIQVDNRFGQHAVVTYDLEHIYE
jgi:hypothetical protein